MATDEKKMIIRKLEMQGFKSFAERTKVVFHPGITAVVGPNGTGKSNLLDALLWAIGATRSRLTRGDRIDDVIFNGNTKRPPLNMADVILTLGSEDEERVISHRIFRNSEGEYRLNGSTARLKDILDELRNQGIGEKEYFVIEQGTIGDFVTSKPADKRLFIEEAAGTAFYKDKKRQAQLKLENTEQNLIRLDDIIAEVEKQKNSLQRQAQAANRYRRLRERIRELSSHHYGRKLAELEKSQRQINELHSASLEKEKEASLRLKKAETELSESRSVLWNLEKSIQETQEKLFGSRSRLSRLEDGVENDSKRIEEIDSKTAEYGRDHDELLAELLHLTAEAEQTRGLVGGLEQEITDRRRETEQAAEDAAGATGKKQEMEQALEKNRENYFRLVQLLTEAKNGQARVEKELELLARQEAKLTSQAEEQAAFFQKHEASKRELESALAEEKAAREKAAARYGDLQKSIEETERKLTGLRTDIANLAKSRDEAAFELQAIRKLEDNERQGSGHDQLPGSLGLLADLVRSTAEDAPLFDVFWKEEAGAAVISAEDFLKSSAGRVNGKFLLLPDEMRPGIPLDILSSPGVLGLLKSRLEAEDRFADLVLKLEDAILVDSLANGVRIWLRYPEFNYISVTGDILLASGLVKAGSKPGGMMTLASEIRNGEEKIARLEADISPLEEEARRTASELDSLKQKADEAARETSLLEKKVQDKDRELDFAGREGENALAVAAVVSKEIDVIRDERKRLEEDRQKLAEEIENLEQENAGARQTAEALERAMREMKETISRAEHDWLEKKTGLALIQEKIDSRVSLVSGLEKRSTTLKTRIDHFRSLISSAEDEREKLKEKITREKGEAAALKQEINLIESALSENEAARTESKRQLETKEAELTALRAEQETLKTDRMRYEINKAEIERDLVNLEEMSWQDIKKTLAELRREVTEGAEPAPEAGQSAPEIEIEEIEEADAAGNEETTPQPRRTSKKPANIQEMSDEEVDAELEAAKESLSRFKAVNLMAEEEYVELKKRYDFLTQQRQDLRDSISSTKEAIRRIDQESEVQFLKALEEVNENFKDLFAVLFKGGNAEVKMIDPENPLESGVEIIAQPPGKRVQNLTLLSGGEKSLTSIAFLFALFRYRPSPFCFLDEVDAALDDVNLARFLELMKKMKAQTQFIIITHNYKTMEVSDYIYGTTMPEPNVTRLLSVKLEKKAGGPAEETAEDLYRAIKENA